MCSTTESRRARARTRGPQVAGALLAGLVLGLTTSRTASAAPTAADSAAAETLFRDGKALAAKGNLEQACDKFAESQRLDPGAGTLLELARCDEQAGRLASAWVEYTDVASASVKAGRADRVKFARAAIARIEPMMAHLTIRVPTEVRATAGLEIRRDGTPVGPGSMGDAIPVDPGPHVVVAAAPGHVQWTTNVVVQNGPTPSVVDVPSLALEPPVVVAPAPAEGDDAKTPWSTRKTIALAAGGAGVVAAGVGVYLGAEAISDWNDVKAKCNPSACTNASAKPLYDSARTDGTVSTVLIIAGAALVAGGAVLFFFPTPKAEKAPVACLPFAAPGGGGIAVSGGF